MKLKQADKDLLEKSSSLMEYMLSGPVVPMVRLITHGIQTIY